ncbi:MAG: tRNA preQ1(34) S-adenosylmethionine ribosyltransferase-isomerase QueA [Hyphomonadaceae bacterium]
MRTELFDFHLPEELIALRPARPRDSARLLVVRGREGALEDRSVADLPEILAAGDVLVANNSRVLRAALKATRAAREPGGPEVQLHINLNQRAGADRWRVFLRPAKRVRADDLVVFGNGLEARVLERGEGGDALLGFNRSGGDLDAAIDALGDMPIPPYIASKRAPDAEDVADYQTTFARDAGSVAAPTAGLHITDDLRQRLAESGVPMHFVTLHVNAGTFLPISTATIDHHRMHSETAVLDPETCDAINAAGAQGGRCIAVGTTALRTLESAARGGALAPFAGDTDIFISPGYQFRAIDGLMTNFHLPRSSLFVLVSALMGLETMQRAYAHAVEKRYRFYSYGDACLLLPNG